MPKSISIFKMNEKHFNEKIENNKEIGYDFILHKNDILTLSPLNKRADIYFKNTSQELMEKIWPHITKK